MQDVRAGTAGGLRRDCGGFNTARLGLNSRSQAKLTCPVRWVRCEKDVDRVFIVEDESVALVQATCRTTLQDIEAKRSCLIAFCHDLLQDFAADSMALMRRREIEVLNPKSVRFWAQCYETDVLVVDLNHAGVHGHEGVQEASADTMRVVATKAFEIGAHDVRSQLSHPVRVAEVT